MMVDLLPDGRADRCDQMRYAVETVACRLCPDSRQLTFRSVPAHYSSGEFQLRKCSGCGLVYVSPRLTTGYRNACYRDERHLVRWFLSTEERARRGAQGAVQAVRGSGLRAGTWLDVGCGIGTLLDEASRAGFTTSGIELNPFCAEYAGQRHSVVCGDALEVELDLGAYDVISLTQVLEHVGEPLELLQNVSQCLRPGGVAFISVPPFDWVRALLDRLAGAQVPSVRLFSPEDHLYYYRPRTMRVLLRSAGLQPLEWGGSTSTRQRIGQLGVSCGDFLAVKCRQS